MKAWDAYDIHVHAQRKRNAEAWVKTASSSLGTVLGPMTAAIQIPSKLWTAAKIDQLPSSRNASRELRRVAENWQKEVEEAKIIVAAAELMGTNDIQSTQKPLVFSGQQMKKTMSLPESIMINDDRNEGTGAPADTEDSSLDTSTSSNSIDRSTVTVSWHSKEYSALYSARKPMKNSVAEDRSASSTEDEVSLLW